MKNCVRVTGLLFAGVCWLQASPLLFSVASLGIFGGGSVSSGRGLSSNGQATGYGDTLAGDIQAFAWSSGGLSNIGPAGSALAFGNGINSSGNVAGYSFDSNLGTFNAFYYNGSTNVPIAPLGGANNAATGINNSGTVVGYSDDAGGLTQAFQYTGGIASPLGTLPGGSTARANGINSNGDIVGYSDTAAGETHAFLFSGGVFTDLGVVSGYNASEATAIADSGAVAGTLTDSSFVRTSFLWTSTSGMITLGTLGGDSEAFGVNSANWVVGRSNGSAFLFENSSLFDLNALLDSTGAGWELQEAMAVNDLGQIVGTGLLNGQQTAFLLTPLAAEGVPEPATWLGVLLGVGAVMVKKMRRPRV